jgi:hypothetical protein
MKPRRVKRLFGSVFTRLLMATLAAGPGHYIHCDRRVS